MQSCNTFLIQKELKLNFREVFNLVLLDQLDEQTKKLESIPHTGYQLKFKVYQWPKWKNTVS